MKVLLLSFLFSQITYAQLGTATSYLIADEKINKVEIIIIGYDEQIPDTTVLEIKFYDSLGRMIERRFDFNLTGTMCVSEQYIFEMNGDYCYHYNNPFVLDGIRKEKQIITRQTFYGPIDHTVDYEIVEYLDGQIIRLEYDFYETGLINEIVELDGGAVVKKKLFIYTGAR